MGGISKGLIPFRNKPMVQWVSEKLRPQVQSLIINAPESETGYAPFSDQLIEDKLPGHQGPLAGLHAAMNETKNPFIITVPCDSPLIPEDLVERLSAPLRDASISLAVVTIESRLQPVFFIVRSSLRNSLEKFLQSGGRKLDLWYSQLMIKEVDFSDKPNAFLNFNTMKELKWGESKTSPD